MKFREMRNSEDRFETVKSEQSRGGGGGHEGYSPNSLLTNVSSKPFLRRSSHTTDCNDVVSLESQLIVVDHDRVRIQLELDGGLDPWGISIVIRILNKLHHEVYIRSIETCGQMFQCILQFPCHWTIFSRSMTISRITKISH
jgi:hypothetical protein